MRLLPEAANGLIRLLFEPPCAACGAMLTQPLARTVCDACWAGITRVAEPYCRTCGDELTGAVALHDRCDRCRSDVHYYSVARSAGRFDGPLREIVHAFKYGGRRLLAEPLALLLREAGDDVLRDVEAVVPVPLHPVRLWRRGFNQADDLARQLDQPVWRVLRRRRHGPSQTSLPARERRRSMHHEFALSVGTLVRSEQRRRLKGATLVLIDDVMTTGATLDACAKVLAAAGAKDVRALTVARAVSGRPHPPRVPRHPSAPRRQ